MPLAFWFCHKIHKSQTWHIFECLLNTIKNDKQRHSKLQRKSAWIRLIHISRHLNGTCVPNIPNSSISFLLNGITCTFSRNASLFNSMGFRSHFTQLILRCSILFNYILIMLMTQIKYYTSLGLCHETHQKSWK